MFGRKPKKSQEEQWRDVLTGEARGHVCWQPWMRRISKSIPSDPRCKLCDTPFGPPGNVMRFIGFGPSPLNRRICSGCIRALEKRPGGAEIELSLLFADVRGSTALAEQTAAAEYSQLISKFYGVAAKAIDRWNGIVDKFVGDQAVALFIPCFTGAEHAEAAIAAAHELLVETGHADGEPWIPSARGSTRGSPTLERSAKTTPWTSQPWVTPSTPPPGWPPPRGSARSWSAVQRPPPRVLTHTVSRLEH